MLLVERYEDEHYVIPASDPIEAIKYFMEQKRFSRKDLELQWSSHFRRDCEARKYQSEN